MNQDGEGEDEEEERMEEDGEEEVAGQSNRAEPVKKKTPQKPAELRSEFNFVLRSLHERIEKTILQWNMKYENNEFPFFFHFLSYQYIFLYPYINFHRFMHIQYTYISI